MYFIYKRKYIYFYHDKHVITQVWQFLILCISFDKVMKDWKREMRMCFNGGWERNKLEKCGAMEKFPGSNLAASVCVW